jgi:DNA invertase Pin-like site-specific DNA recombinase
VGLKILNDAGASIDTTRPDGKLHFGMLAPFAEFEREVNRERTKAGMAAAKRRGPYVERPRRLTAHQIDHAKGLIGDKKENRDGAAASPGAHAETLRRTLNGLTISRTVRSRAEHSASVWSENGLSGRTLIYTALAYVIEPLSGEYP